MLQNRHAAILLGLCAALNACESNDPIEPEAVPSQAGEMSPLVTGNTWATKRSLTPWRRLAAAGAINGIIYVAGGWGRDAALNRVDAYNIATNTWSRAASLPAARADLNGGSVINGKLYVTGGTNRDGVRTRSLYLYDPRTNSWTRKADMPRAGCGGDQGVIGGQLYVYTGCQAQNTSGAVFFRYNPSTNTWIKRAAPPVDHSTGAGAVIGGKFYLDGGFTPMCGGSCIGNTHNLDVYNPATNRWTTRPGTGSHGTTAAVLNGKLYIIGGEGDTFNRTVEAYDPATNMWTSRARLPEGSSSGTAAAANGKLYYLEGATAWTAERPSVVYAYTP